MQIRGGALTIFRQSFQTKHSKHSPGIINESWYKLERSEHIQSYRPDAPGGQHQRQTGRTPGTRWGMGKGSFVLGPGYNLLRLCTLQCCISCDRFNHLLLYYFFLLFLCEIFGQLQSCLFLFLCCFTWFFCHPEFVLWCTEGKVSIVTCLCVLGVFLSPQQHLSVLMYRST